VILVEAVTFLDGGAGAPMALGSGESLFEVEGGEADTLETTEETTDRSTVYC
jgi:hypothetical protein